MFGAPPENPENSFVGLCSSNTPIPGVQTHLCWPMGHRARSVLGATPEPKEYFLVLCSSKNPIPGIQNHLCWPMKYSGMGVWSTTPEPKQQFLALCSSKHPHPRYPTTPLLAYGVQRYECLGRHPRTQIIFLRDCAIQTPPSRVSKNTFAGP